MHTCPQAPQLSGSLSTGKPLSTTPSQSLSMPSQSSTPASPGVQLAADPPAHEGTERWHAPTPQVTVPASSSICPLQLSSLPLHDSACGVGASHATTLLTRSHCLMPP